MTWMMWGCPHDSTETSMTGLRNRFSKRRVVLGADLPVIRQNRLQRGHCGAGTLLHDQRGGQISRVGTHRPVMEKNMDLTNKKGDLIIGIEWRVLILSKDLKNDLLEYEIKCTSRAPASRVTEVSRRRAYKDKEEPIVIGTTPDHLAGTAVDCVISWKSLSLTFLSLDIFAWCCHFLLIWLAPDISESWQPFLSTALKPETWHTFLSWQVFSDVVAVSWNRCRFSRFPLTFLSLGILSFGHLFSWDLLLLTFSSLHISFSWHGFRLAPFFLFPVVSHVYFETSFC